MFLKTEASEQDASECLKLGNPKGYYRRACASLNMGKFAAARKDFRKVVALYPRDQSAAAQLKACEKLLRQQRVLAALSRDENVQIDWRTIIVEDSYDGPRLRDEKDDFAVDVAFCEHLTRVRVLCSSRPACQQVCQRACCLCSTSARRSDCTVVMPWLC
ncbi:MAG: hypothetical protein MHM6MM_007559 [Cercozoa sp. M6MM]